MPDSEPEALPVGRLNNVRRTWDFQGGWVRAPFYEIMFNNRLTKQARLLWLWLSWVRPESRNISWADCEETMRCGTKARRLCLAQLVQEGFVTVEEDGVVILHDPYEVFRKTHDELIPEIKKQFDDEYPEDRAVTINVIRESVPEPHTEKPKTEKKEKIQPEKDNKLETSATIIGTWNESKPASYSKMRTLSAKQLEAVSKHLKNLSLKKSDLTSFIQSVCKGLAKSDFWSNKVDTSGRNFSAVFGYGNPHDTKLKNVENLYMLGQEDSQEIVEVTEWTDEQRELIKTYRYVSFQFEKAKNRNNHEELSKWQKDLDFINQQLQEHQISMEAI